MVLLCRQVWLLQLDLWVAKSTSSTSSSSFTFPTPPVFIPQIAAELCPGQGRELLGQGAVQGCRQSRCRKGNTTKTIWGLCRCTYCMLSAASSSSSSSSSSLFFLIFIILIIFLICFLICFLLLSYSFLLGSPASAFPSACSFACGSPCSIPFLLFFFFPSVSFVLFFSFVVARCS